MHDTPLHLPISPLTTSDVMRGSFITLATALTAFAITAKSAQLPLYAQDGQRGKADPSFPQSGTMGSGGVVSPFDKAVGDIGVGSGSGANLADTLTLERRAGLWWDYARDISAVVGCLGRLQGSRSTTQLTRIDDKAAG
jgi:hypothetical protein